MTPQEIESKDMRKAAIHEMGHAIVARHYGIFASPVITRRITDDLLDERTWDGSATYYSAHIPVLKRRRLAMAGMLAELMDNSSMNSWQLEDALECSYLYDEWSDSDYEAAQGWSSADFRVVYSILQRNWDAIEEGVTSLIRKAA